MTFRNLLDLSLSFSLVLSTQFSRLFAERTLMLYDFVSRVVFSSLAGVVARKSTEGARTCPRARPAGRPVKRASAGRVMSPMKCEKRIGHERDPYLMHAPRARLLPTPRRNINDLSRRVCGGWRVCFGYASFFAVSLIDLVAG